MKLEPCDRCGKHVKLRIACEGILVAEKSTAPTVRAMLVCSPCYRSRDFDQLEHDQQTGKGDARQLELPTEAT